MNSLGIIFLALLTVSIFIPSYLQSQESTNRLEISLTSFLLNKNLQNSNLTNNLEFIIYLPTEEGCNFISKNVKAKYYGESYLKKFEIYSTVELSQEQLNNIRYFADEIYNRLYTFLNKTHYDQDNNGKVEILIANLNEGLSERSQLRVNGYSIPGKDVNGKSLIYIDISNIYNYERLKSVIAHELAHLFQASFSNINNLDLWIVEGTANWLEDYALDSNPNKYSLYLFEQKPNVSFYTSLECLNIEGYIANYLMSYIFFEFLVEKFNYNIIKTILELSSFYNGINLIEKATNSSFFSLFLEFGIWNYLGLYKGTSKTFEDTYILVNPSKILKNDVEIGDINYLSIEYIKLNNLYPNSLISMINNDYLIKGSLIKIKHSNNYYTIFNFTSFNNGFILIENTDIYDEIVLIIIKTNENKNSYKIINYKIEEIYKLNLTKGENLIKFNLGEIKIKAMQDDNLYILKIDSKYLNYFDISAFYYFAILPNYNVEKPISLTLNLTNYNVSNHVSVYLIDQNKNQLIHIPSKISNNVLEVEIDKFGIFAIGLKKEVSFISLLSLQILFMLSLLAIIISIILIIMLIRIKNV